MSVIKLLNESMSYKIFQILHYRTTLGGVWIGGSAYKYIKWASHVNLHYTLFGQISLTPQLLSNLGTEHVPAPLLTGQKALDCIRTKECKKRVKYTQLLHWLNWLTDECVTGELIQSCEKLIIKLLVICIVLWQSTLQIIDYSSGVGCTFSTICSHMYNKVWWQRQKLRGSTMAYTQ